jgi:hypothetical protein
MQDAYATDHEPTGKDRGSEKRHRGACDYRKGAVAEFDQVVALGDNDSSKEGIGIVDVGTVPVDGGGPSGEERVVENDHSLASHRGFEENATLAVVDELDGVALTCIYGRRCFGEHDAGSQLLDGGIQFVEGGAIRWCLSEPVCSPGTR